MHRNLVDISTKTCVYQSIRKQKQSHDLVYSESMAPAKSANNIGGPETAVTSGQPHFLLRDQPEEWDAYVCECDDNRKNVQENRSILLCVYLLV